MSEDQWIYNRWSLEDEDGSIRMPRQRGVMPLPDLERATREGESPFDAQARLFCEDQAPPDHIEGRCDDCGRFAADDDCIDGRCSDCDVKHEEHRESVHRLIARWDAERSDHFEALALLAEAESLLRTMEALRDRPGVNLHLVGHAQTIERQRRLIAQLRLVTGRERHDA